MKKSHACMNVLREAMHDEHFDWQAKPLFKDRKKFQQMADPALEGQYPVRGLYQVLAIAAMCIQDQPNLRPPIGDIVKALTYLASQTYDPKAHRDQQLGRSPSHGHGPEPDIIGCGSPSGSERGSPIHTRD